MMYASQNGHVIVLERLLQHGARVDLQTQVYNNVLIMQVYNFYCVSYVNYTCIYINYNV